MLVPRALQVDAVELDSECLQMLKSQFSQAVSRLKPGLLERYNPEISAILGLAVYVVPLYTSSSLVGQQLLALEFDSKKTSRLRPLTYGIALVTLQWLQRRIGALLPTSVQDSTGYRLIKKCSSPAEVLTQIANLANTLIFLREGLYPTLLHRFLRLGTRSSLPDEPRGLDFSFMARELLWHSFAELFMFTLPLLNVHRLKRLIINVGTRRTEEEVEKSFVAINSPCAQCNQPPILPRRAVCSHIFCYYCLEANTAADPQYHCPLCLQNVRN